MTWAPTFSHPNQVPSQLHSLAALLWELSERHLAPEFCVRRLWLPCSMTDSTQSRGLWSEHTHPQV